MSATAQGVEAQQALVDITTNAYQKSVEVFFSQYCSYALTLFFHELAGLKKFKPSADARQKLLDRGLPPEKFDTDGTCHYDFALLKQSYSVLTVAGSIAELEDEKQLRVLNQLLVSITQSMNAVIASGDETAVRNANAAITFIIGKIIEISGATDSSFISELFVSGGDAGELQRHLTETRNAEIDNYVISADAEVENLTQIVANQQQQLSDIAETIGLVLAQLGAEDVPNRAENEEIVSENVQPETLPDTVDTK